jgi:hypothetical protein
MEIRSRKRIRLSNHQEEEALNVITEERSTSQPSTANDAANDADKGFDEEEGARHPSN